MARSRIGMWLIGAKGGVATTALVGLTALKKGLIASAGLVSELPQFAGLKLAEWNAFAVGVENAHVHQAGSHPALINGGRNLDLLEGLGTARRERDAGRVILRLLGVSARRDERGENEMKDHGVTSLRGGTGAR